MRNLFCVHVPCVEPLKFLGFGRIQDYPHTRGAFTWGCMSRDRDQHFTCIPYHKPLIAYGGTSQNLKWVREAVLCLTQNVDSLILLDPQEAPSQNEHLKAYECPGAEISMK